MHRDYYNGEGYADPTAFEAIMRAERAAYSLAKKQRGKDKQATQKDGKKIESGLVRAEGDKV